jgi:hypothetical protein
MSSDDLVAIDQLQRRYADVVTRRAWAELEHLFLPDAPIEVDTVTRPVERFNGPTTFRAFVAPAVDRFDFFAFVILNSVVDLDLDDPDVATGRIFMCEVRHDPGTGRRSSAYGRYLDRYVRTTSGWRFAERRYRSLARTGPSDGPDLVVVGRPGPS